LKKREESLNQVVVSTVGTAQKTVERVPQLDWIVTARADHAARLWVCRTHVWIPAEVIDQLVTTNLHCWGLC